MSVTLQAVSLADEIIRRRVADLEKRIVRYPRKNSILSDISDCERSMVYAVLDWDKRPVHDADLQARFDVGNLWEREIIREIEGLGFRVILSQMPVEIKNRAGEIIATGRIDGFIEHDGGRIPFEIKTMNPNLFNRIKSIEDFQKYPYMRKYIRQLTSYLYGHNQEQGLFIIVDGMGHWKLLPLNLDYGDAEAILNRLERVHLAIKSKTYPDRIPYDQSICGKCPFAVTCLQDIVRKETELIDNEALEADLDRHEELKPLASEFDELHDKIKGTFKGIAKAVVGTRYLVMSVPSNRTTYELTPEAEEQIKVIKAQFSKKVPMERLVIERLDKKTVE